MIDLNDALDRLVEADPEMAEVAKLRLFRRADGGGDGGGARDFNGHGQTPVGLRARPGWVGNSDPTRRKPKKPEPHPPENALL